MGFDRVGSGRQRLVEALLRQGADYLYEPGPEEIFRDLLPRYVQAQVYRALLESNARLAGEVAVAFATGARSG
mgnify:CR=1 FL=1